MIVFLIFVKLYFKKACVMKKIVLTPTHVFAAVGANGNISAVDVNDPELVGIPDANCEADFDAAVANRCPGAFVTYMTVREPDGSEPLLAAE